MTDAEKERAPETTPEPDSSELSPPNRARLEEFEEELAATYRRQEDRPLRRRKRSAFLQALIDSEEADAALGDDELRQEEHEVISANLVLSLFLVTVFVGLAILAGDRLELYARAFSSAMVRNLSWFYILLSAGSLIFLFYLALSRFGPVVLGEPDSEPEFSDLSWYSMLFSAGMGVGLLFNGVAEPVSHYMSPPLGEPQSIQAARKALAYTAFHWGLNAWGIYILTAVGVAYFGFRRRKKYLISSSLLGLPTAPQVRKPLKVLSDLVATLAVVFGVAASLGMGVLQIAGGLKHAYGLEYQGVTGHGLILLLVTVLFLGSAMTGLDRGIKILSNLNMGVAAALVLFVLGTGPTLFCLKVFVDSIGQYVHELPRLCFQIAPFTPAYEAWMGKWTLPYFTWWIAWAPFVGVFIARISRGRTIRELVLGGLVGPTVFSMFWFAVLGGTALHMELMGSGGLGTIVQQDITVSLFSMLERLPLSGLTTGTALLLIFTFLVTSADSACFVISMMTTEGDLEPSMWMKSLWGVLLSMITFLLISGGGITALQSVALTCAFPFALVLVAMAASVFARLSSQVERERI